MRLFQRLISTKHSFLLVEMGMIDLLIYPVGYETSPGT